MNETSEAVSGLIGEVELDGHAPGGGEVGDGEVDLVSFEGGAGDLQLALVVVF